MAGYNENADAIRTQSPSNGVFGAEVQPMGPLQDMFGSIDTIVGSVHTRDDAQATFTGGMGGVGYGGVAEPPAPGKNPVP